MHVQRPGWGLPFVARAGCWPALVGWLLSCVCAFGGFLLYFLLNYAFVTIAFLCSTLRHIQSVAEACTLEMQSHRSTDWAIQTALAIHVTISIRATQLPLKDFAAVQGSTDVLEFDDHRQHAWHCELYCCGYNMHLHVPWALGLPRTRLMYSWSSIQEVPCQEQREEQSQGAVDQQRLLACGHRVGAQAILLVHREPCNLLLLHLECLLFRSAHRAAPVAR